MQTLHYLPRTLCHLPHSEENSSLSQFLSQKDILDNAQFRHQSKFLVDDRDSQFPGICRRVNRDRQSVDLDLSLILLVNA